MVSRGGQLDFIYGKYGTYGNNKLYGLYGGYGVAITDGEDYQGILNKFVGQISTGKRKEHAEREFTLRAVGVFESEDYKNVYIEPFYTLRLGRGPLKFTSQIGVSIPVDLVLSENNKYFIFNLGTSYRF